MQFNKTQSKTNQELVDILKIDFLLFSKLFFLRSNNIFTNYFPNKSFFGKCFIRKWQIPFPFLKELFGVYWSFLEFFGVFWSFLMKTEIWKIDHILFNPLFKFRFLINASYFCFICLS